MKFTVEPMHAPAKTVHAQAALVSLCAAQEKLLDSYMGLTESYRHLDEVTTIMDNIQTSIEMLKVHGANAVPLLNFDAGLESLMGVPEKLITAEKAIEDLEKQDRGLWGKFVDGVKAVLKWIKDFIVNLYTKIKTFLFGTKKVEEKVKAIPDDQLKEKLDKPVPAASVPLALPYHPSGNGSAAPAPEPVRVPFSAATAKLITDDFKLLFGAVAAQSAMIDGQLGDLAKSIMNSKNLADDAKELRESNLSDIFRNMAGEVAKAGSSIPTKAFDVKIEVEPTNLEVIYQIGLKSNLKASESDEKKSFTELGWTKQTICDFINQSVTMEKSIGEYQSKLSEVSNKIEAMVNAAIQAQKYSTSDKIVVKKGVVVLKSFVRAGSGFANTFAKLVASYVSEFKPLIAGDGSVGTPAASAGT